MQTIQLTDTEARIAKIEAAEGSTTVTLEWGGPDDMYVQDFDIDRLGKLSSGIGQPCGGNLFGGWALLDGPCLLKEGDVIPASSIDTTMITQTTMRITQTTKAPQWGIESGCQYSEISESAWSPGGSGSAAIAHFLGDVIKLELRHGTNQGTRSSFLPDLHLMSIFGTSVANIRHKLLHVPKEMRLQCDRVLSKLMAEANKAISQ